MIRGLVAGLMLSVALPQAALACSYGGLWADAVVDAVALYTEAYPEPGRRDRSLLDWAQTRDGVPEPSPWFRTEFTQLRVVNYLYGEGPSVLDVSNWIFDDGCVPSQSLHRGERYLIGLKQVGGDWSVLAGYFIATGYQREHLLEVPYLIEAGGFVYPFDSQFEVSAFQSPEDGPVWPTEPPPLPPNAPRLSSERAGEDTP